MIQLSGEVSGSRVLVTGGTGFLGRRLVQALRDAGQHVTVLSRQALDGAPVIRGDLLNAQLGLGDASFATVYHLAGMAHVVPMGQTERDAFFRVNVDGTRNLLRALGRMRRPPQSMVLASTVAVYGRDAGVLLDETTPRDAADPYGASKRYAEDLLSEWCNRHGVRATIARLPLVVGKNAPGNFGAMVEAMRRGRYCGIGGGTARRSMVLATDVARGLLHMAGAEGVFHLTDGRHPSFLELEAAVAAALGRRRPLRLPTNVAQPCARFADALQAMTGRRLPFNTRRFVQMTSTLTFSDQRARRQLGWNALSVVRCASEWLSTRPAAAQAAATERSYLPDGSVTVLLAPNGQNPRAARDREAIH